MSELLTIREASGFLGVSEKTVRRKIRSGHLLSSVQDGKYLINKGNLEVVKNSVQDTRPVDSLVQAQLTVELRALKGILNGLTEENKRLQYEIKETRLQNRDLTAIVHDLAAKMTKLLPAPEEEKAKIELPEPAKENRAEGFWGKITAFLFDDKPVRA